MNSANQENQEKQMNDPIFDEINNLTSKDHQMAEACVNELITSIDKSLKENPSFNVKHALIALGQTIVFLTQSMCENADVFQAEMDHANRVAIDKLFPSLMPTMKDGQIVDENFDKDDVSLRRVIMAIGVLIDYTLWRNELSHYASMRANAEASLEQEA